MSERTLHRQLKEEGATLQAEDEARRVRRCGLYFSGPNAPSSRLPKQQGFATRRALSAHSRLDRPVARGISDAMPVSAVWCRRGAPHASATLAAQWAWSGVL